VRRIERDWKVPREQDRRSLHISSRCRHSCSRFHAERDIKGTRNQSLNPAPKPSLPIPSIAYRPSPPRNTVNRPAATTRFASDRIINHDLPELFSLDLISSAKLKNMRRGFLSLGRGRDLGN
jgi:hypothetical protein